LSGLVHPFGVWCAVGDWNPVSTAPAAPAMSASKKNRPISAFCGLKPRGLVGFFPSILIPSQIDKRVPTLARQSS
jgi:hypothetical protein